VPPDQKKDKLAAGIAKIIVDWEKQTKVLKRMQWDQAKFSQEIIACEKAMGAIMRKSQKVDTHLRGKEPDSN
jgi:uncharacterized protein GlcG (DUF336 family)